MMPGRRLGVSVHKSSVKYPFLSKESTGFGFSTSARLWGYWGASLAYNFEDVESAAVDGDDSEINSFYRNYYNYSGTISSVSPTLYYSSIDSPVFPHFGTKLLFSYRYSGGLLGGDVNLHKTKFQFLKYIPVWERHTLGMQLVHQSLAAFGNKPIPTWEKFFLGEQSIRGYGPYGISPRNENGDPIGGNKAFYLNLQYEIPLNRQFSAIFFYDMGNAYDFGVPISLKDVYSSMGLELKIFVPMLNVPFRLIFAYNPRIVNKEDRHFDFRFTVGTSFN
jgi:outer membrane protein insertion porin family